VGEGAVVFATGGASLPVVIPPWPTANLWPGKDLLGQFGKHPVNRSVVPARSLTLAGNGNRSSTPARPLR
jgi:hypothetical protein